MRIRHLALPALIALLALLVWGLPQAGATTYIVGDLVISSSDSRSVETIDITGSVFVQAGGSASWTDVTVAFNSSSPSAHGLYIDGAATFNRVNITALPGTTLWWFKINSTATFQAESCDFSWMNGSGADPGASGTAAGTDFSGLVGGVQIYSNSARIGNSSVHDGLGADLYVQGASPRVNNNHLFDARYLPFEYATSFAAGRQTSDFRLVAACAVLASGQPDMDSNRVERCGLDTSANATDLGVSNATLATSNLRLVGVGVVVLGGSPSFRQGGVIDAVAIGASSRAFQLGGVSVTQNLYKLAAWGILFKDAAGATTSGGFVSNADSAFEIYMDAAYAGGAVNFDLFLLNVNGSYVSGFTANIGGHGQPVALALSAFTFGQGGSAAVVVRFTSLSGAHSVDFTGGAIDMNGGGTGITVEDQASSGKLTVSIATTTFARTRAPVSVHLEGLTGGASLTVHNNTMNNTAGFSNVSTQPFYRGAIDVRWTSLSTGTLSLLVADNDVFNQTWQTGGIYYAGVTAYSSGSSNLPTTISVRRNDFSNVSDGAFIYENYGQPQNSAYALTDNHIAVAHSYGLHVESYATGGNIDPTLDRNYIDRADSYAVYWYISSGNVASKTFGNNTVLGTGISRCCGFYFAFGTTQKWVMTLVDSLVFNTSIGVQFAQVNVNIYRSNLTITSTAVICGDCVALLYETELLPLSASVTGTASEVTAFLRFGSPRVQWQGDGGLLITSGNLRLVWLAGSSPLTLATIALNASASVENRSIAGWRKTPTSPDQYANLTPFIHVGNDDITGTVIPFINNFYGNITLIDPLAASVTITTPGDNAQVRARSVTVKGTVFDLTTGVAVVRISGDGVNFTDVASFDPATGAWEDTLVFAADGTYKVTVRAWDRARYGITFGDFSFGFGEDNITGLVIDTIAPRLFIDQPFSDTTTNLTSYVVRGQVTDANALALFRFSFNGADQTALLDGAGNFQVIVSGLKEGPNLIALVATDLAGNTNVLTRTIVLDTIAPHLIVFAPLNNSFTNRAGIEVSGEVESDVVLTVNGVSASFPFPIGLKQGLNRIWVSARDRGNNTANILLLVTLDTAPPGVTFTSPSRFPFATRDPHVTISGTTTEPIASLIVDGVAYPLQGNAPQSFTFELYLEDGSHSILVHVTDLANNSFEISATPVIVDTQAPSLRVDSPADRTVQSSRTISFRGRTDPNALLTVATPAGVTPLNVNPITGEFAFPDTRTSDGVITYVFEASDAIGNVRSVSLQVTIDTTPPAVEILGVPSDYETTDQILGLHGTVSPGARVTITVASSDASLSSANQPVALDCSSGEGTPCTYNFNLKVASGLTTVSIVATDLAGNQAVKEVRIKRDVAAADVTPAAMAISPFLALAGLAIGIALIVAFQQVYRRKAQAAHPGVVLKAPAAAAPAPAPVPEQADVIYEEHPQDMYATDAMRRQPRAPRPPREPPGGM